MPWEGWGDTLVALAAVGSMDLGVIARRKREVTVRGATGWVLCYVALTALFALALLHYRGHREAAQFVAGYLTEYSLSVDNLLVFLLIMTKLRVPSRAQDKSLYIGIVLSLGLRKICIIAGVLALSHFTFVYYALGLFLIYTAIRLVYASETPEEFHEYAIVRAARRVLPITDTYQDDRIVVRQDGRRRFTPMVIVILAIGVANVIFGTTESLAVIVATLAGTVLASWISDRRPGND